jgi:hypothetical protein
VDESRRAIHCDSAGWRKTAAMEQGGDTARTVSALLDLGTIGVEYSVEHDSVGSPGRLEHQRLVESNACMPIREVSQLVGGRHGLPGGRIEHDKVVAHAMHLREIEAHG